MKIRVHLYAHLYVKTCHKPLAIDTTSHNVLTDISHTHVQSGTYKTALVFMPPPPSGDTWILPCLP